jgi:hypothetical protein
MAVLSLSTLIRTAVLESPERAIKEINRRALEEFTKFPVIDCATFVFTIRSYLIQ